MTDTLTVPEGFELSTDSVEPTWFGAGFEDSFAAWDFNGTRIMVITDGGSYAESMTIEEAEAFLLRADEMKRQIKGVLELINPKAA